MGFVHLCFQVCSDMMAGMRASGLSVGFLSLTLWMRALKVRLFKSVLEVAVTMNDLKGKRKAWKLLNFS